MFFNCLKKRGGKFMALVLSFSMLWTMMIAPAVALEDNSEAATELSAESGESVNQTIGNDSAENEVNLNAVDTINTETDEYTVNNENDDDYAEIGVSEYDEPTADSNGVYQIATASQLFWFAEYVNAGNWTASAKLTADIDLSAVTDVENTPVQWTPIGPKLTSTTVPTNTYGGTFDGGGYTIKNLKFGSQDTPATGWGLGLFSCIKDATIQNLKFADAEFYINASSSGIAAGMAINSLLQDIEIVSGKIECSKSGNVYVGGITGYTNRSSYSDVSSENRFVNCVNRADISGINDTCTVGGICGGYYGVRAEGCVNYGDISGRYYVGGICGQTAGSSSAPLPNEFSRCVNYGKISASHSLTSTSTSTYYGIGGIVGVICYKGDYIEQCINHGEIVVECGEPLMTGGIVGKTGNTTSNQTNTVRDCYNTGTITDTNNKAYVGGIVGATKGPNVTVENCYNIGAVNSTSANADVIANSTGSNYNPTVTNCYYLDSITTSNNFAAVAKTESEFKATGKGDNDILTLLGANFTADTNTNNGYPILRWQDPNAKFVVNFDLVMDTQDNDNGETIIVVKDSADKEVAAESNGTYELANGSYTYTVSKKGYEGDTAGSFVVSKANRTITVNLQAIKYSWEFNLTPADADFKLTNAEGAVIEPEDISENNDTETYTYELYNGTYTYSASKFGYIGQPETALNAVAKEIVVAYADGGEDIILVTDQDNLGRLTFDTKTADSNEDVEYSITVSALSDQDYADTVVWQGTAMSNQYFPAGQYSYSVKAAGYETAKGEFELSKNQNLTIPVTLAVKTDWDGQSVNTDWYDANSEAETFYIYTEDDLAGLAQIVNNGKDDFAGKTIELMADLNLGENNWTAIGSYNFSSTKYFAGTFDGNGCSITLNHGNFLSDNPGLGLFGYIKGTQTAHAVVKNLIMYGNLDLSLTNTGVAAMAYVGSIVGYATYTDFSQISNRMNIDFLLDCGGKNGVLNMGGLAGWVAYCSFDRCSNTGNLKANVTNYGTMKPTSKAGGLIGMITQSTIASQECHIRDCYNNGDVSALGYAANTICSGLVASHRSDNYVSMYNCYNSGDIYNPDFDSNDESTWENYIDPLVGDGAIQGNNNYYLLPDSRPDYSGAGQEVTADELKALANDSTADNYLGENYKPGVLYPVLTWEAAPLKLAVKTMPNKTEYNDFESFDGTGMVLTAYYTEEDFNNKTNGTDIISGWQVLNGENLKVGTTAVTVSYMGVECDVPVTVKQIVHYITSDDLIFNIAAPVAGQIPQTSITLTAAQQTKIKTAKIEWFADGEAITPNQTFQDGVFYRAKVTLEAVYTDGDVWYNFESAAIPEVNGIYELLYRTLSNQKQQLGFTLTYNVSNKLTDKASHLYYNNDSLVAADYAQYLDNKLTIKLDNEEVSYTVAELEKMALAQGLEAEYSNQGLNSRDNSRLTGLPLYDLLCSTYPQLINADGSSEIVIGEKTFTWNTLRSRGGSYDVNGNLLENGLPYLLAYGSNGIPYTAESGPLALAAPAFSAGENNSANFINNVNVIDIKAVAAKTFSASFRAVDSQGSIIRDAFVSITDQYGNKIYEGETGTVKLNQGETYTYALGAPGYGIKTGVVDGDVQLNIELLPSLSDDNIDKYKDDTYKPQVDENGCYLIKNADELMWFNYNATRISHERSKEMMQADVRLLADIDLSGADSMWVPMGALNADGSIYFYVPNPNLDFIYYGGGEYCGTFDGNGHTVYNLNVDWENYYLLELSWDGGVMAFGYRLDYLGGLFGMTKNAAIKDLGLEGSIRVLDRPTSIYADWYMFGGLVGFANNTDISGCYTNIDMEYNTDDTDENLGGYSFGGFPDKCDLYMGGIVGAMTFGGNIENCYSTGAMSGGGVRCVRAGGILGAGRNGTCNISKCYSASAMNLVQPYFAEVGSIATYAGGIVGGANVMPISGDNSTNVEYCFALNPYIQIDCESGFELEYAHANRVIGDETVGGKYNQGLYGMVINGAAFTQGEDEQSYRTASGRSIVAERAYLEQTFANLGWNDGEEVWNLALEDSYPIFAWQQVLPTGEKNDDSDNPGGGSGSGGSGSGNGSASDDPVVIPQPDDNKQCSGDESCVSHPYTDVDTSLWYHKAIDYVISQNLFNGLSDNQFAPNNAMTRGMFVTVLSRYEKMNGGNIEGSKTLFADVAADSWYEEGVNWAADAGIVNGVSASSFAPNDSITREQLAAMLYRYAEYLKLDTTVFIQALQFSDAADVSPYAVDAVKWAVENDIMIGKGGSLLDPVGTATRAEVAALFMRFDAVATDE